jgi:hypothetical protein
MKVGLGIMWVPPSHHPPVPKVAHFLSRVAGSFLGSSTNRGTDTAPLMATLATSPGGRTSSSTHPERMSSPEGGGGGGEGGRRGARGMGLLV